VARFIFWLGKVKAEGLERFPGQGPVIIAANHISFWDPVVVAALLNRPVSFMAKEELFEHSILASFFSKLYVFPVKRGTPDRKALKKAMEVLEEQGVLGIFPEGTRSKTGELSKPQHGIAMLALKTKAPVVPVACLGTDKIFPWGWISPVIVKYGEPVRYEEYYGTRLSTSVLEEVSKDIMDKISDLLC
jgi:1-acyl-sn-glycerol-3-phosphate acyltransferase